MKNKILLVNGPLLGMLGTREPEIYGTDTLEDIENYVIEKAKEFSIEVKCFQSDSEEEIIDFLNINGQEADGIIINPASLTHQSNTLFECLKTIPCPIVEVHITNLYKREEFRHKSVTAPACDGVIMGLGKYGYYYALIYLVEKLREG